MDSEIQNRFNTEWGCNNQFPCTEVFDRHFQMLDELEKRIPRYHPALWKGDPKELDAFLIREREARGMRSGAVDWLYQNMNQQWNNHLPPSLKVTFIDPNNIWGSMIDESYQEPLLRSQEVKIEQTEPKDDDGLDRFFNNASPIPHHFTNLNERSNMGEDYVHGIPLIRSSSPPSTSKVEEYHKEVSRSEAEKEAKRQETILRRKESYKRKKLENKLNNAFIVSDNKHSRCFYNSSLKTDHPLFNLDVTSNCFLPVRN